MSARALSPPLLSSFCHAVPAAKADLENVPAVLHIIEGYVLLGREGFVATVAQQLDELFQFLLGNLGEKGVLLCLQTLSLVLVACPPAQAALPDTLVAVATQLFSQKVL